MQVFLSDRRAWKREVVKSGDARLVLLVHIEDDIEVAVEALRREHEFNEAVSGRAGSDQLGIAFALSAIQRTLDSGIASRLGGEMYDALLQARGAMENGNRHIEARLRFQKGSNAWAEATNAASRAIQDAGGPLVTLRAFLRRRG
jgi:hypothetical protein